MTTRPEVISLRFAANLLQKEMVSDQEYFNKLDQLWSEFFYCQNHLARILHRFGDLSSEERDRQWAEIDEQECEWQAKLEEWLEKRFYQNQAISQFQRRLRELSRQEVLNVAA